MKDSERRVLTENTQMGPNKVKIQQTLKTPHCFRFLQARRWIWCRFFHLEIISTITV